MGVRAIFSTLRQNPRRYVMASELLRNIRRNPLGRALIALFNHDIKARLPDVRFPVYLQLSRNINELMGRDGGSEKRERAHLREVASLEKARVFWDVGANIGQYSWELKSLNPTMKCCLFEPDPRNAQTISRTIATAGLTDCQLFTFALSNQNGETIFYQDQVTGKTGSIAEPARVNSYSQVQFGLQPLELRVQTRRADDLLPELAPPDILKVDVEGAEQIVLDGAWALIARYRPALLIEILKENAPAISARLEGFGYQLLDAVTLAPAHGQSFNILALHRERHAYSLTTFASRQGSTG
ncbi:FkbM family methyltransferase [Niveispirillum sp. SYP-B3756]|nr:FkbM family methyltransferase [Niveispirillum sp. SYP-B3756]